MTQNILKELLIKKWIKFIVGLILFVVISCGIASLINYLILQPSDLKFIDAENKTGALWLGFWATFLSALASFAMVLITWKTLIQMKQQWDYANQPRIGCSLEKVGCNMFLVIHNCSNCTVENMIVTIIKYPPKFVNAIGEYDDLNKIRIFIPPHQSKRLLIGLLTIEYESSGTMEIRVDFNNTYSENYILNFEELIFTHDPDIDYSVRVSLEEIARVLKKYNYGTK